MNHPQPQTQPPEGTVRDWLDRRAERTPKRISHCFAEGEPLAWEELRSSALEIALRLTRIGIEKGESVALMSPNGRQSVLCLYGALYGGFRITPINLAAGPEAIGYALRHSGANWILLDESQLECFEAARQCVEFDAREIPVGDEILWPGADANASDPVGGEGVERDSIADDSAGRSSSEIDSIGNDSSGDDSGAGVESNSATSGLHEINAQDDALLMYTSGTTGSPKGVVHSHASLLAGGWTTALAHRLSPEDRALCILPIYHINGLCVTIIAPLVSGGSVAVCGKFSASRFWKQCAQCQATWFSAVPTIFSHLLHAEGNPDQATRRRLRFARSASSPLAPEVQAAFEKRFEAPVVETMGLTETAAQILSNPLPPGLRKIGSPGIPWGNEAVILSPDSEPLPAGVEGEIAVRGPNLMRFYLNDPKATSEAFASGGWLRTGDLGKVDEDGYFFVTGRLKEIIIKGGENIAPREIDEALHCHPDVVEAAAFALPCETYGERIEAAVALRPDAIASAEKLLALCREKLGEFKSPDRIHILDELPKGPSGKIQRRKLAERAESR